ncbi:hypothetical protein CDAR_598641 [Caerostris darwini]|uniref:Uncharacterized protein n=1 Tax=Caerostris darwini TaxID=1538125 RepID=A0AAV4VW92_9ARAC|nr:hypothetical protein CDAR_598641 [Caerostris darwini]
MLCRPKLLLSSANSKPRSCSNCLEEMRCPPVHDKSFINKLDKVPRSVLEEEGRNSQDNGFITGDFGVIHCPASFIFFKRKNTDFYILFTPLTQY